ncbi:Hydrolase (fragment) [Pseudomonas sp. 8AS]|uniref:alpha/beta fold hydrolase n=1 Tax=Pseudomonas sp. 8AS TaxID=2653163 RepID=UPI0012F1A16A
MLYLVGRQSPVSAREVARLLAGALPQAQRVEFAELGHMGPITHPQRVNPLIADFLQRHCAA